MSPSQPEIYTNLASWRARKGIERTDLAHTLGITPQLLGYIELGKHVPDLALALRISEALDVPLEHIFSLRAFPQNKGPRLV